MSKKRTSGQLGNVKGADMLRMLADKLAPAPLPPSPPTKKSTADEQLLGEFQRRRPPKTLGTGPSPPMAAKRGTKKVTLRVPKGLKAAMMANAQMAGPTSSDKKIAKGGLANDLGEGAFQRIAYMRPKLHEFSANHYAVETVPQDVRNLVQRRIVLGASMVRQAIDPDDGHFIGYDFGTSTTKAVLRHPYRRSAFAVPVPEGWASLGQAHLWPTVVWYNPESGQFSLLPELGWRRLEGFKSALIEGLGLRTCSGCPILVVQAAAAFLALHLAYVIGTALERDPELKISGINLGVPVAALADVKSMAIIERSIRLGFSLIESTADLRRGYVQSWEEDHTPIVPYALHTELSGAIAGYCTAPRYFLGPHMIIDCGSATLDMASFRLGEPNWPVGIYSARVEPLGADSCIIYQAHGATQDDCRKAARYEEFEVYRDSLARSVGFAQDRGKYPYQVILIGGGIHGEIHKVLFEGMAPAFHRAFHHPELARDLEFASGVEPGRLILADGLARAPIDLREVAMPKDRPPPMPDCTPNMITKDQV